jgi:hypothetical protein
MYSKRVSCKFLCMYRMLSSQLFFLNCGEIKFNAKRVGSLATLLVFELLYPKCWVESSSEDMTGDL